MLSEQFEEKKWFKSIIFCFIIIGVFLACLLSHTQGHNWGGDFSLYIRQSKSILDHNMDNITAHNAFTVGQSSKNTFSPIVYPWGFPLLLSPVYYFFGFDYYAFKIYESVCFVAFLCALNLLLKNRIAWGYRFYFIAFLGLNVRYLDYTNNVLSEFPFLAFSFLSLYYIDKLRVQKQLVAIESFTLGGLLFFSFFIRTEGAGLLVSLFSVQLYSYFRGNKTIVYKLNSFLPYVVVFILYLLTARIFSTGFTSHFEFRNLISANTIIKNLIFYQGQLLAELNANPSSQWFFYLVLLIVLIGVFKNIPNDLGIALYLLFMIVLYSLWPFHEYRYFLVIFPLPFYFLLKGLSFIANRKYLKYGVYVVLFILLMTNVVQLFMKININHHQKEIVEGPETELSQKMFSYVKSHTKKTDVIAFFRPRVMNLYTDRKSVMIYGENEIEEIRKTNYCIINKNIDDFCQIKPTDHNLSMYKKVYENNQFTIYLINK